MSDSRTRILEGIRRAHGRGVLPEGRRAELAQHLTDHPANLVPARGQVDGAERLALFAEMVEASAATLARVDGWDAVGPAVADYLKGRNLPTAIAVAPDARLDPVAAHGLIEARRGPALPQDVVGVSLGFAGIAETGSMLLVSGPQTPTSLNFLPDIAVVVIDAATVAGTYEEAWAAVRRAFPDGLPRTLNLITGPSRTGDIEQTIQLGAHGPRQVHVVLVDERTPA